MKGRRCYVTYHMMTSSNGNIFRVTGHLCGEFTGPRWIPRTQRRADVLFDMRLNKRLSKQWRGWWFETLSRPLWWHRNYRLVAMDILTPMISQVYLRWFQITRWRQDMETFYALLNFCVHWWKGAVPVMRSSGVFFVISLGKLLSKQLSFRSFETPCDCNDKLWDRDKWPPSWRRIFQFYNLQWK